MFNKENKKTTSEPLPCAKDFHLFSHLIFSIIQADWYLFLPQQMSKLRFRKLRNSPEVIQFLKEINILKISCKNEYNLK